MKLRLAVTLLIVAALASSTILASAPREDRTPSVIPRVVFWYSDISGVRLVEAAPTLAVVDPDEITSDWVRRLRASGTRVLAYVNFGMAENWRSYWNPEWLRNPPQWLGPEDPKWRGEYLVRFWNPEWLEIVKKSIRDFLDRGFSGVMLDNIDVCIYWGRCSVLPEVFREIREEMRISLYVNLGEAWEVVYLEGFVKNVDGVIVEEALTRGEENIIQALNYVAEKGKDVVLIEYAKDRARVEELLGAGESLGFKTFVGDRKLNRIPDYIPLYHGIQYLDGRILYSYKQPWERFKIYLNDSELGCGEYASGAVNEGVIAVAYETEDKHVKILLDDKIIYESKGKCREPSITPIEDGFAAAYICDEKSGESVYLLRVDVSGKVRGVSRIVSDKYSKRYPVLASNGEKLALVFEREGLLIYTDFNETKIMGKTDPYSYTITPFKDGFAVIYAGGSEGEIVFPNVTITGVPKILWETNAVERKGFIYYISREGWVIRVCPNGMWTSVKQIDNINTAGMWISVIDDKLKVFGLGDLPI